MNTKRPESVLVVIYTASTDCQVLLLQRCRPASFWQSVTGSLEWDETDPLVTARRELAEETGLRGSELAIHDCQTQWQFPIKPAWRQRYAPDVRFNTEYVFTLALPEVCPITLNPTEHSKYLWLPRAQAAEKVTSYTNRDAILQFVPITR